MDLGRRMALGLQPELNLFNVGAEIWMEDEDKND